MKTNKQHTEEANIEFMLRAVNSHEELVAELHSARLALAEAGIKVPFSHALAKAEGK